MIIKVCGMRDALNIRHVEQLHIDWMGFIFYPPSPRYVEDIPTYLPSTVQRVGVFVNADMDFITQRVQNFSLDYVQLHGDESPKLCSAIRKITGKKIIKAFGVKDDTIFKNTSAYEPYIDYFLFDSFSDIYGGSGKVYDHNILHNYSGHTPFLLSGGLGPEHLTSIKAFRHPQFVGVDLNSQFEIAPALKSVDKLQLFINEFRKNN